MMRFEVTEDLPIRDAMLQFRIFYTREHLKIHKSKRRTAMVLKTNRTYINKTLAKGGQKPVTT